MKNEKEKHCIEVIYDVYKKPLRKRLKHNKHMIAYNGDNKKNDPY